jgi:sigma-B regulation protein RsbU (phosphoserine phosphatase)
MDSSREVGGDYFDYFPLDSRNIGFAIADVAGKGIPAALQMTTLRATFRTEATRHQAPNRVVGCLNQTIDSLKAGQFICFFYGTFSRTNRLLRYCNAGMNPPVLFRKSKGHVEPLKRGGPVLGVRHDHHFRIGTLKLEPGDLLMLYTDGLTEQTNQEGEFFDLERLIATVKVNIETPIDQLRETIFSTVSQFGGLTPSDDRTVMLLKFS